MWPDLTNPLSALPSIWGPITWGQVAWAALLTVPPAIVLLYFLKLKRQPLEVPSTYLWHKSIEDLRVNSIWQRLRQNLLLFLQILLVFLAILALLGMTWKGTRMPGDRFIFLIDTSASMAATDVAPSRLEDAKRQVGILIDAMKSGDVAMIVSFSDSARVEQLFSGNRKELQRRLAAIKQTQRTTDLSEALKVASGLANPGRSASDATDVQVAEALPATMYIFSDGKFDDVKQFALGSLTPRFIPIGQPDAANVGITAFSSQRNDERPDQLQAFGRLENHGAADAHVEAALYINGALADASAVDIPAGKDSGVIFNLDNFETGMLQLKLESSDALALDDAAWAAVNKPRHAKVLLLTPGNEPLQYALATGRALEIADATIQPPGWLASKEYQEQASTGAFDLIIYDRCRPPDAPKGKKGQPVMPQANTLFIGAMPPAGFGWSADERVPVPLIVDTDRSHPLMQLIELGDILINGATPLELPPGSTELISAREGTLFAISPREAYEDAVLGFEMVGEQNYTNWPVKLSFPLFVLNVLEYLGRQQDALATGSVRPGKPVLLRSDTQAERLTVTTPQGDKVNLKRGNLGAFNFAETNRLGPYEVMDAGKPVERFAVNLFDSLESDIRPRPENAIKLGHETVQAEKGLEAARREAWKWLLLLALAVLLFEWYIYNRRVYI